LRRESTLARGYSRTSKKCETPIASHRGVSAQNQIDISNRNRRHAFVARPPTLQVPTGPAVKSLATSVSYAHTLRHISSNRTPQPLRSRSVEQHGHRSTEGLRIELRSNICLSETSRKTFRGHWLAGGRIIDLFFRRKKSVVGRPRGRASVLKSVGLDGLHSVG
jgi:hypothetical protein